MGWVLIQSQSECVGDDYQNDESVKVTILNYFEAVLHDCLLIVRMVLLIDELWWLQKLHNERVFLFQHFDSSTLYLNAVLVYQKFSQLVRQFDLLSNILELFIMLRFLLSLVQFFIFHKHDCNG